MIEYLLISNTWAYICVRLTVFIRIFSFEWTRIIIIIPEFLILINVYFSTLTVFKTFPFCDPSKHMANQVKFGSCNSAYY